MSFNDAVADWMRRTVPARQVERVVSVRAFGTDWAGDTEGGFHSRFDSDIEYVDAEGQAAHFSVEGESMESLWRHIVSAWPADVDQARGETEDK